MPSSALTPWWPGQRFSASKFLQVEHTISAYAHSTRGDRQKLIYFWGSFTTIICNWSGIQSGDAYAGGSSSVALPWRRVGQCQPHSFSPGIPLGSCIGWLLSGRDDGDHAAISTHAPGCHGQARHAIDEIIRRPRLPGTRRDRDARYR
jgi:hypothetical protein